MAGFRLPGILCAISNAVPIDTGTAALTAMPPAGPVGLKPRVELDRDDPEVRHHLSLIEGLRHPAVPYTLENLRAMRTRHGALLIDSAFEFGEHSTSVRLQRQTLAVIDELIREQRFQDMVASVPDKIDAASEVLQKLLDRAERPDGGGVSLDELRRALHQRLEPERTAQLLGMPDKSRHPVGEQVMRACKVSLARHQTELGALLNKASGALDTVQQDQLTDAIGTMLGDARQIQLLGGDDGPDTARLLQDTARLLFEKKSRALQKAYDSSAPAAVIARADSDYESAKQTLSMLGIPIPQGKVRGGSVDLR